MKKQDVKSKTKSDSSLLALRPDFASGLLDEWKLVNTGQS